MFEGVYTAMITPFHADGSVDEEGFLQLLKRQIQAQVSGIVVLGTTSETSTLTAAEKKSLIQIARKAIKGSIQLIVGTGTNATRTTIEETQKAEDLGADAVMVVTPYYNKPTQEGIFQHFEAVSKAASLPIIVYNVAGRTGQNIQTATLKRLMQIRSIVAVKEASGNIDQIMELIEIAQETRPDFKVLSGDDNLTLPIMSLGGHGVFSVVSNLVPALIKELYDLCLANDWKQARKLHYELLPLFKGAFIETNPIPIKALLRFEGLPAGACRLPLCAMSAENEKKLRHLHETIKLPLLAL